MDNPSLSPSPGPSASMANRGRYNSFSNSAGNGINSPRRIRKRRDPSAFNILIIGAKNSGKTSFLNLLLSSLAPPNPDKSCPKNPRHATQHEESSSSVVSNKSRRLLRFSSQYLETKIDNELFGITIWDSEGLIPSMIDLQLRDIVTFLESKFEETYDEEVKLARDPGVRDTQVHCVFLLLDPVRIELNMATSRRAMGKDEDYLNEAAQFGGLDAKFDLQALRMLCEKTTVIPVVTKADTVTVAQMSYLKRAVWESIRANGLDPFDIINRNSPDNNNNNNTSSQSWPSSSCSSGGNSEGRNYYGDNDDDAHEMMANKAEKEKHSLSINNANGKISRTTTTSEAGGGTLSDRIYEPTTTTTTSDMTTPTSILPLSIISPDTMYHQGFYGRDFPWGSAQTDNPLHCDFSKLTELIFVEWRDEMREASRVFWYERWRTARLDRWNNNKNASTRRVVEVGNRR